MQVSPGQPLSTDGQSRSDEWSVPPHFPSTSTQSSIESVKCVFFALDFLAHCSVGQVLIHKMTGKQLMDDS